MATSKESTVNPTVSYQEYSGAHEPVIEQANGAMLLDIGLGKVESGQMALKTASDGHTLLIPQPSEDPNDPLNWSETRKHLLLFAIAAAAFLADFQAAIGVAVLIPQGVEWHMSPTHVIYAANLAVLMIGIGGCFWIPFIYFWGRAPVLFWTTLLGTLFTLGTALVPTFKGYYGLRALMCFTLAAGQTTGLAFIQDVFFFHQHARKIGIWTSVCLMCPYFGPMFGLYIVAGTGEWRNCFWMTLGLEVFVLILIVLFVDETWYRRDIAPERQPDRAGSSRVWRLLGIWQIRHHRGYFLSVWNSTRRLPLILIKPVILGIFIFVIPSFMWVVGINATSAVLLAVPVAEGGYGFGERASGYLYFAPVIGVLVGEVVGHWGNDWIVSQYIRKHGGLFKPEARLWPVYPSAVLMVGGIVLVGQALQHHLPWSVLGLGWAMYIVGIMMTAVAITTYMLDCYGTAPGELASLLNLARILGGFSVGYFQLNWGLKAGFDVSFGTQGGIVGASVLIVVAVHVWGPRLRAIGGPLTI